MEIKELAFRTRLKWFADYNKGNGESLHFYLNVLSGKLSFTWTINKMIF
jgi:hypothetical protein